MNKHLSTATATTTNGLAAPDPKLLRSISDITLFRPDTTDQPVILRGEPPAGVRTAAVARVQAIDAATRDRDPQAVKRIVLALLAPYSLARNEEADAAVVVAGYVAALRELPVVFVAEAAAAWTRGEVESQRAGRAPMPDELYREAKRRTDLAGKERFDLMRFLSAKVQPQLPAPGPKPSIEELQAKYGKDWGISGPSTEEWEAARAAKRKLQERANDTLFLRECEAAGVDPNPADGTIAVSPTLAALVNGRKQDA